MTREDAFEIWLPIIKMGVKSMPECSEAVDMAIKALKQEPCTDAISRQMLKAKMFDLPKPPSNKTYWDGVDDVGDLIDKLPPVIPAEKVGRWKRISMDKYSEHAKYWYRCDRCGEDNLGNTNYCPNCGQRKMQEAEDEN